MNQEPDQLSITSPQPIWQPEVSKGIILIVDDTPTNLGILFEFLSDAGFKVLVAVDGKGAIEQIKYTYPDIILLDIMMPEMDGFETCRHLKSEPIIRDIPIIFMTALTETVDKITGFSLGAVDYITKPFQNEEVLSRINTHLMIRRLQQELQGKNAELAQINQNLEHLVSVKTQQLIDQEKTAIIGRLTQGIVHNIKNPLQSILGFSCFIKELVKTKNNPDLIENYSEKISEAAQKIELVINNLMQKSFMDQVNDKVPINLNKLLQQELQLFMSNYQFKYQVNKKYDFDETLPQLYLTYSGISQIFNNLVQNAMDAMWDQNSQVLIISTRQDTGWVYIDIQDNGCGIPSDHIAKIFDPFYTSKPNIGDQKQENEPTGTGLGLYTCMEIIKPLGGEIKVTSEINVGSIFTIVLPKELMVVETLEEKS